MGDYSNIHVSHLFDRARGRTCADCGEVKWKSDFPLLWRKNVSRRKTMPKIIDMMSNTCSECHRRRFNQIKKHPAYSVEAHKFCRNKLQSIGAGAFSRDIDVLVMEVDILQKLLDQRGICALSGIKMTFSGGLRKRSNTIASLDRIDSNHPYTVENIQWVCAVVNVMKNDLGQTEFIDWCKKILRHRCATEEEMLTALS